MSFGKMLVRWNERADAERARAVRRDAGDVAAVEAHAARRRAQVAGDAG